MKNRICLFMSLTLLAVGPLEAQRKPAPQKPTGRPAIKLTAEQIMDRGAEAMGPRSAWDRIRSSVMTGTLSVKDRGMEGTVTLRAKRPNKFVMEQNVKGIGVTRQGYDGKVGWSKDPIQGLRKLEGAELAAVRRAAVFDAHIQWRKFFTKWEVTGIRKVNGRDAYVVKLSPAVGRPTVEYHDVKNFRLVRTDMVTETPRGPLPIEVYPSDYRKVSGVLVPFVVRQRQMHPEGPVEVVIRIRSVKTNVPIPDSAFAMPKN